jgi:hypothetical protein
MGTWRVLVDGASLDGNEQPDTVDETSTATASSSLNFTRIPLTIPLRNLISQVGMRQEASSLLVYPGRPRPSEGNSV